VEAAKNKQYLQYRTIALRSSILVLQLFSMFYNVLLEFIIVQQCNKAKSSKIKNTKKWGAV
jgi:hypothetical protein